MKKSFMFVAVAAAGMLASCSSESLTAGSDPQIEPTQEELVPIEISVATPMARTGMTRGTGTVGGVVNGSGVAVNNDGTTGGTPKSNIWAGQKVNVYMFEKGTLNIAKFKSDDAKGIFENAEMDTPPASENTASGLAHYVDPAASGRYLVKYYPLSKSYDFWGYRIDDATTATAAPVVSGDPTASGSKLTLDITVDGTQDVLGAKTSDPVLPAGLTTDDLYSAKAARKSIQPELEFNHLMTRLTFEGYPGNDNAKTVYVTGIKVRPIKTIAGTDTTYVTNTGTLDIAGTGDGFTQKITWGNAAGPLTASNQFQYELKQRASIVDKTDYTALAAGSWYSLNSDPTNPAKFITSADWSALNPSGTAGDGNDQDEFTAIGADSWYSLNASPTSRAKFIDATAYAALPPTETADPDGNQNLVALTEVDMDITPSNNANFKRAIGEAIIAPDAHAYELEIDLKQSVAKYEDSNPGTAADWEEHQFQYNVVKTVAIVENDFKPGYSYDFVIKVYGLEKIEVTTVLKPWIFGEAIGVETE